MDPCGSPDIYIYIFFSPVRPIPSFSAQESRVSAWWVLGTPRREEALKSLKS